MPDPFDPAEFDAPPPSDPGADYRILLDAMRKAGAEGVAQQVAARAQLDEMRQQSLTGGQPVGRPGAYLVGTAAVIGHTFPLGRKGGKGVATALGVLLIGVFPGFIYNLAMSSVKVFPGLLS